MDTESQDPITAGSSLGLSVSAAARRLGVAPSTLRSWQRRYGIGPQQHLTGRRRHYLPEDVAWLDLMHTALTRGASPAEAARWALRTGITDTVRPGDELTPAARSPGRAAPGVAEPPARPGGRRLRMVGAGASARGLGRATLAMDPVAIRAALAESISSGGVVATWDEVVRPVLAAVAERWAATGEGVEIEHLLTECLVRAFDQATQALPPVISLRPVLLACVPGDTHSLPLSALTAALAERRVGAHLLGVGLPQAALAAAVRRTAPVATMVWAQAPADADAIGPISPMHPRGRWFAGGPGWSTRRLPPGVVHLTSLRQATTALGDTALGRLPASGP